MKKFTMGLLAFLLIGIVGVTAAVLVHSFNVDVTVSEALSSTTIDTSVSAFAGETKTVSINVANAASVPLNVVLAFSETTNVDGVVYTTDMPKTVALAPGANTVLVSYTVATDSPNGLFDGVVTLNRVA